MNIMRNEPGWVGQVAVMVLCAVAARAVALAVGMLALLAAGVR